MLCIGVNKVKIHFDTLQLAAGRFIYRFVHYIFKKENNETALSNHQLKGVSFFDIGETTELSSDVRDRLRDTLGPDAVETWNTLNLGLNYEGFLKKYFPELSQF